MPKIYVQNETEYELRVVEFPNLELLMADVATAFLPTPDKLKWPLLVKKLFTLKKMLSLLKVSGTEIISEMNSQGVLVSAKQAALVYEAGTVDNISSWFSISTLLDKVSSDISSECLFIVMTNGPRAGQYMMVPTNSNGSWIISNDGGQRSVMGDLYRRDNSFDLRPWGYLPGSIDTIQSIIDKVLSAIG